MPKRVRLSRKKGWRLPSGTINVARPGVWGNPFRVGDVDPDGRPIESREDAVALYRRLVVAPPPGHRYDALRGKDLACWCPLDGPCHADVLLERVAATVEAANPTSSHRGRDADVDRQPADDQPDEQHRAQ